MNPSRFLSMIEDAPARAHAWNDMSEYARREAVQHRPEFLKYVHLSWERLPMNIKSGLSHLGESKSWQEYSVCASPDRGNDGFWRVAAISMVSARQTFLQSPDGRGAKVHSVQRVEADDVRLCTKVGDVVFGSTAL